MIYDFDTGEVMKDKFAQLFFKDIETIFKLTGKQRDLLFLMIKHIGLGNTSSLIMTPKRKKEFASKLEITTTNSISNMLRQMERCDILKRLNEEEEPNKYTVNPDILFSGNDYQRAKIMIDYSGGKRNVRAFSNDEALIKYIKENKNEK